MITLFMLAASIPTTTYRGVLINPAIKLHVDPRHTWKKSNDIVRECVEHIDRTFQGKKDIPRKPKCTQVECHQMDGGPVSITQTCWGREGEK
jgi:hypothetical protein